MVEPEIEEFQEEYDQYDDSEIFNIRDPGLNRSSSYQIYKTQDLLKLREAKISDAMKDLYLTRDEAIIVLIGFRWDLNKFKDVWYDNVDQYRIKFQIDLDPYLKEIIEKKIKKDICRICDIPLNKNFFSLKCGHSFCEDCWIGHCESKIEDINSILLTSCPQNSCSLLVPESVFLRYLSSENKEILNVAILKNFTDANNDIRWCPTPNCGICIQSQSHSSKDIECECGASFCFSCTKEAHRPCQCEMIDVWDKKNNSEAENVKWLMVNTKKCPNCKKFIEKNQGCNHMTCRKEAGGCSYEFCWICMQVFTLNHYSIPATPCFGLQYTHESSVLVRSRLLRYIRIVFVVIGIILGSILCMVFSTLIYSFSLMIQHSSNLGNSIFQGRNNILKKLFMCCLFLTNFFWGLIYTPLGWIFMSIGILCSPVICPIYCYLMTASFRAFRPPINDQIPLEMEHVIAEPNQINNV